MYAQLVHALPELYSAHAAISEVVNLPKDPNDPGQVAMAQHNIDYVKEFIGPEEKADEPFSDLLYPIMDCASELVTLPHGHDNHTHQENCSLVGVVGVVFFWRDLLRDILPPGTQGIVGVFQSSCNHTFSHQINGPQVEYLGPGDMHDARFSHMKRSAMIHNLEAHATRDRDYTGLPIGKDTCSYQLHLYPSLGMFIDHTTNIPIVFTIVAVLIFVFTSGIFLMYDWYVERRQRLVLHTAVQSTANVSVLEEKVRERTTKLENSNKQLAEANDRVTLASARQLQHFACMSHEIR